MFMERLREGANGVIIKSILALIILSFALTGLTSYFGSKATNTVATIAGEDISRNAFERTYQNERNRMQSQFGESFTTILNDPTYVQSLRQGVLDKMINDLVIANYVDEIGLAVSPKALRKIILQMPEFQSEGHFDQAVYQRALQNAGLTSELFADYLRRDELRKQIFDAVQGTSFVLQGEAKQQGQLQNQQREVQTLTLSINDFAKKIKPTDKQIEQYYQTNSQAYMQPEQADIAYLELSAQELRKQIKITDQEAQAYYKENITDYTSDPKRKLSHILLKDKAKAEEVLDKIKSGQDFITLAKAESKDITADKGGNLGWVEQGTMDAAFEKAAFSLANAGDVSDVIKSEFGYHIIHLDALEPAKVQAFTEVSKTIQRILTEQKSLDLFYQQQKKLEKIAFESPDSLEDAEKLLSLKAVKTGFVDMDALPAPLNANNIIAALTSDEVKIEGLNSEVIEVSPEHVIVVRVNTWREETLLPLDEVKGAVKSAFARQQGKSNAVALSASLLADLQQGKTNSLAQNNLTFANKRYISRQSPLASEVFALAKPQKGQVIYGKTTNAGGDIVLIALHNVEIKGSMNTSNIKPVLLRSNRQQAIVTTMVLLRDQTAIDSVSSL